MPFIKNENTTVQQAMQQAGQMVTQVMGLMNQQKLIAEQERNNNLVHRRAMATQTWKMISDLAEANPGGLVGAARDYPEMFVDLFYQIDPKAAPGLIDTRLRQLQNGALKVDYLRQIAGTALVTLGAEQENLLGEEEKEIVSKQKAETAQPQTQPKSILETRREKTEKPPKRTPQEMVETIEKGRETGPWAMYDKLISEGKAPLRARLDVSKEYRNKTLYLPELEQFKKGKRPGKVTAEMLKSSPTIGDVIETEKSQTPAGKIDLKKKQNAGAIFQKPLPKKITAASVRARAAAATYYTGWIADEVKKLGPEKFATYYQGMVDQFGGAEMLLRSLDPESMKFMKLISDQMIAQKKLPFEIDESRARTINYLAQAANFAGALAAKAGTMSPGDTFKNNNALLKQAAEGMEYMREARPDRIGKKTLADLVAPESVHYSPEFAQWWKMFLQGWTGMLGAKGLDATIVGKEVPISATNFWQWWIPAEEYGMVPTISYPGEVGEGDKELKEQLEADLTPEQRAYLEGTRK